MSEEETPRKGMSRRNFLRSAAVTPVAAATSGAAAGASAATGIAGIMADYALKGGLPKIAGLGALIKRANPLGTVFGGDFPRTESSEQDGVPGVIAFEPDLNMYDFLRKLPPGKRLSDLLSDEALESFAKNPENSDLVETARQAKDILGPYLENAATPIDAMGDYYRYFERLAEHAINNPDDFGIFSEHKGYMSGEEYWGPESSIKKIWGKLKTPPEGCALNEALVEKTEGVRKQHLDTYFERRKVQEENQRKEAAKRYNKMREKEMRESEARERKEREDAKQKQEERDQEKRENPDKRSKVNVVLEHIEGDRYAISGNVQTTQVDWHQWALSINPNAKPHHVQLEEDGRSLIIKNIPENIDILRTLYRSAEGIGRYTAHLPNRKTGIDMHQGRAYKAQPGSDQFGSPETNLILKVETASISASDLFDGANVLGIDFKRAATNSAKDALTDLNNIAGIKEVLESKKRHIGGYNSDDDTVTIVRFDVERFKNINDQYGHAQGDIMLQELAHRISKSADYESVIGRVGGDEIVVIYYGGRRTEEEVSLDLQAKLNKKAPILITNPKGEIEPIGIKAQIQNQTEAQILQFPNRRAGHASAMRYAA